MDYWWERRRAGERTAPYLSRVLGELGPAFAQVANQAGQCWYDDYFCPDEIDDGANIHRLVRDLLLVIQVQDTALKQRAMVVAQAAKNGEFDGTLEESREWGRSVQGRAVFAELLGKRPPGQPR